MKRWTMGLVGVLSLASCHSEPVGEESMAGAGGASPEASEANAIPLTPQDGWIDGASNSLGIQGAMFAVADVYSYPTLVEEVSDSHACLRGTVAQATHCAPDSETCDGPIEFGAFLGLNLAQSDDAADLRTFDARSIKSVAFEVSGPSVPPTLQFAIETDEPALFCASAVPEGPLRVATEALRARGSTAALTPPALRRATRFQWRVPADESANVPFDFCVERVRVFTD